MGIQRRRYVANRPPNRPHLNPVDRLKSPSLESQAAGLQYLWLASWLKPWLRTIDGLRWLMAASHGLRVEIRL